MTRKAGIIEMVWGSCGGWIISLDGDRVATSIRGIGVIRVVVG
jgi:hypothetical protein